MKENSFAWKVSPVAARENILCGKRYRFTVLTPSLLRLEYAPDGAFEDRASQTAFHRDFPRCDFTCSRSGGLLILQTEKLRLTYREEAPFGEDTLTVKLLGEPGSQWHYGEDFEDLGGTVRTLDGVVGACKLGRGIVSRNGFSVLDDSKTLLLEPDGGVGLRQENTVDVYFFGYGYAYLQAVQDFYRLTGIPPMLPAYALGNWWSRYHAYTQQEYCDLIRRFQAENVPFSVSVVDMDWHIVELPDDDMTLPLTQRRGWTGYTWNEELFPDYKAFLRFLKENNLYTALNLHPALGVQSHEKMYREMAAACGIDPESGEPVKLDILSRDFMEKYFDILHHPYEKDGVDFWWMDWQQGTDYWWLHERNLPGQYRDPRERMDPLWLLNHLHILDISRSGKRPMFFSRYAGPGSQRYPVGFSGDTYVTWEALDFQPYFTATATNIGYTAWSHDIGGHMRGYRDDALQVRWLQLGVFSPINRLHSTNSEFLSKEPWCYPEPVRGIMKHWLRLRHKLFPYLYTMNHLTHTRLLPLVQPMYYSHPKCQGAYEARNQFWFGTELMAAPITSPQEPTTGMGRVKVWLPKGDWFDFFTGLHYHSPRGRMINAYRKLSDMPVFAKAGAIVPMAQYRNNRLCNADAMEVTVFPGGEGSFTLYEDAGDGNGYKDGAYVTTQLTLSWGERVVFTVSPAEGDLSLIPVRRTWTIDLRGFHKAASVAVNLPGAEICRIPETNTTRITVMAAVTETITVTVSGDSLIHDNSDVMDRCRDILLLSQIGDKDKVMDILRSEATLRTKLRRIEGDRREWMATADALRELLTLTQEEFCES